MRTVNQFFLGTIKKDKFSLEFSLLNTFETAINVGNYGACLGSDHKVYVAPHNRREILVVDQNDNVISIDTTAIANSTRAFCGAVDHGDFVYFAPYNFTRYLRLNIHTLQLQLVGSSYSGNFKWYDVVKHYDGCFYSVPNNAGHVLKMDPITEITSMIGVNYGSGQFNFGISMPNGKIYFSPNGREYFHEFDPVTGTGTDIGANFGTTTLKFGRMCAIDDRYILVLPWNINRYCLLDTVNKTTVLWGEAKTRSVYSGGVHKLYNGKFYTMPSQNPLGSWEIDLSLSDDIFYPMGIGEEGSFSNGSVRRGDRTVYGAPNSNSVNGVLKLSI
jgi:hypothetical protein